MFRNRTIAHSQSDLAVTYAFGVLDAEKLEVIYVAAPNISSTMPPEQVRNFIDLADKAEERLEEVIEPIRKRLMGRLADADRAALKAGLKPAVRELLAADFESKTTRPSYPVSHPVYLTRVNDS
jgi:exoribonuclease II